MGLPKELEIRSSFDGAVRNIQQLFEVQLSRMLLGEEQIRKQTLDQLQRSLERVNEAIQSQESFNVFRLQFTAEGLLTIAQSSSDMHFEMRIAPLLLERKSLIIERIIDLQGKEKIEDLRDLLIVVSDEETRNNLSNKLNFLESNALNMKKNLQELQERQEEEIKRLNNELRRVEVRNSLYKLVLKCIIGLIIVSLGIYTIFAPPSNLAWFFNHPRKLALQVSATLFLIGIVWGILDSNNNRRFFAFGSIAVAVLIGVVQLL